MSPILEIADLSVAYRSAGGDVHAVEHVNLTLQRRRGRRPVRRERLGQVDPRLRRDPAAPPAGPDHQRQRALPRPPDHPGRRPGRHPDDEPPGTARACAGARSRSCSRAR